MLGLLYGSRVSPLMVAVYGIVSMVGGFIALDPGRSGWASVAVVSSVATVAALALLAAGAVLVRVVRGSWRLGLWLLPAAVIVGLSRAVVLVLVAEAVGTPVGDGVPGIAVSSSFSAVIWLGLVGLLVAGQDAYRERYRSLVREAAAVGDIDDLDRHPGVHRMRATITSALQAAEVEPTPQQWALASSAIRHEIDSTLRPLSHRLWFGGADEEPHSRWSRVVRDAISGFHVPVLPAVMLWLIGSLIGGVALLGSKRALLAAGLSTAILLAVLVLARRLMAGRDSLVLGSLAVAAVAAIPIALTDAIMRRMGMTSGLTVESGLGPLLWLALAGLLILVGSVTLAASDRREVLAVAARGGSEARVSSYLHNSLQSELTGMAMQLNAAALTDDPAMAREALERVQALLSRSFSQDLATFHEEPTARAERVALAWVGICAVSIVIDPAADVDPLLSPAVTAAEELISNAVRHSGATHIEVTVTPDGTGALEVECCANSPGQHPTGSGLGSAMLTSVSSEAMTVVQEGGSTRYRLRITASPKA